MNQRAKEFAASIAIGIGIAITLALGHVTYGIHFENLTGADILRLDSYVFFIAYSALASVAGMYYILRKDISETIAVGLAGFWALTFGFQDIVVYLFLGYFRETYPWLTDTPAGIIPSLLNTPVTTPGLIYNAFFFAVLTGIAITLLYKYEEKIELGIEL